MIIACIFGMMAILSTGLLIVCCVHSDNISRHEEEKFKDSIENEMNKK